MNTRSPFDRYRTAYHSVRSHGGYGREGLFFIERDGVLLACMGQVEQDCLSDIRMAFCDKSEYEILMERRTKQFWDYQTKRQE